MSMVPINASANLPATPNSLVEKSACPPEGLAAPRQAQLESTPPGSSHSLSASPTQRQVLPWVCLAAGLVVLPNATFICWPKFVPLNVATLLQAAGLVLLPCLLRLPVRAVLLAWLPFVLAVPAVTAYHLVMHNPVREWALLVLIETNEQELKTFLVPMLALSALAFPLGWLYWRMVTRKIPRGFRLGWPAWLAVYALVGLPPLCAGWDAMQARISDGYPVGTLMAGWKAAGLRHKLATRESLRQDYAASPASDLAPGQREVHILVIGEAARYASFQINGYSRPTTPWLARNPDLLSFHNVTAGATCTLFSVPLMLTVAKVHTLDQALTMPSCIQVFRKAGFKTYWLSTQRKHGKFDTTVSAFARDADYARFLSGDLDPGGGAGQGAHYDTAPDGDLLPLAREILARNEPRVLLVLHTMGSHMCYHKRYPPQFNYFHADNRVCDSVQNLMSLSPEQIEQMTNAYDNSVRYTDWVLSQIIETLAAQKAVSTCLYVSDHGENSGHAPSVPFAHGTETEDVLHVPMFVWLSPQYRVQRPAQTAALRAHQDTPFSSNTTFHTLVDLAAIRCILLDRSQSAASPNFTPDPRLIAHYATF
jgi:glucan phosphoethanolaminetransferase (alkaline phosphatase superfamily)